MFLSEVQVNDLVEGFMPRVKEESISAMKDVACHGSSILASAQKHKITHQSLSKNLSRLKELQSKIAGAGSLLPSPFLLKEIAGALRMADISFVEAKSALVIFCEKHGGRTEQGYLGRGVRLYLDNTITCVFENPNNDYEHQWDFDQNDSE